MGCMRDSQWPKYLEQQGCAANEAFATSERGGILTATSTPLVLAGEAWKTP